MPVSIEDLILDLIQFFNPLSTGGLLFDDLHRWRMDRKTRDWPTIRIKVIEKQMGSAAVTVNYSYSVGEEKYWDFQERKFHYPEDAQRYYEGAGPSVARYDPQRPGRSWISD